MFQWVHTPSSLDIHHTEFYQSRKLFALSIEDKNTAARPDAKWHHRGYSSIGKEQVVQDVRPNTPLLS